MTIEFTGLRPGEKLDEELLIAGERGVRSTKYSKIFVVEALNNDWSRIDGAVKSLEAAAHAADAAAIHRLLRSLDIGYHNTSMPRETPAAPPEFGVLTQNFGGPREPAAALTPSTREA